MLRRHLPDLEHYLNIAEDAGLAIRRASWQELDPEIITAFSALITSEQQTNMMLMPRSAQLLSVYHMGGRKYADYMTSEPNSSVCIQMDQGGALTPARIQHIFNHRRRLLEAHGGGKVEEVFMAIRLYVPTTEEDPFRRCRGFGAACFSRDVDVSIRVIRASQVQCHAIIRPWDESTLVIRPLNRVDPFITAGLEP